MRQRPVHYPYEPCYKLGGNDKMFPAFNKSCTQQSPESSAFVLYQVVCPGWRLRVGMERGPGACMAFSSCI